MASSHYSSSYTVSSSSSSNSSLKLRSDLPVLPSFREFLSLSENAITSDFSDHTAYYHIKRTTWMTTSPNHSSSSSSTKARLSSSTPHGQHAPFHPEPEQPIPMFPVIRTRDPTAASQPYSVFSQAPSFHDKAGGGGGVLKRPSPVLLQQQLHVHDDHHPPPSEQHRDTSLTKAGNPRKRSERACTRCRELKVRCEPSNPICSHCWRRGYTCDLASR